jgi:hypothetical protein
MSENWRNNATQFCQKTVQTLAVSQRPACQRCGQGSRKAPRLGVWTKRLHLEIGRVMQGLGLGSGLARRTGRLQNSSTKTKPNAPAITYSPCFSGELCVVHRRVLRGAAGEFCVMQEASSARCSKRVPRGAAVEFWEVQQARSARCSRRVLRGAAFEFCEVRNAADKVCG